MPVCHFARGMYQRHLTSRYTHRFTIKPSRRVPMANLRLPPYRAAPATQVMT